MGNSARKEPTFGAFLKQFNKRRKAPEKQVRVVAKPNDPSNGVCVPLLERFFFPEFLTEIEGRSPLSPAVSI